MQNIEKKWLPLEFLLESLMGCSLEQDLSLKPVIEERSSANIRTVNATAQVMMAMIESESFPIGIFIVLSMKERIQNLKFCF